MPNDDLKQQLTDALNSIIKLEQSLLSMDASGVREKLREAQKAIRPMLYVLRTPEENQKQRKVDSYT